MNAHPNRVSMFLSFVLLLLPRLHRRAGWLAVLLVFGTALTPASAATSATLYVSKISLDKRPDPADIPGAEVKLSYYCAEGFRRLNQEVDAVRGQPIWPLKACTEDRFLSHKADELRVVYVEWQAGTCALSEDVVFHVEETSRKTALATGISAVVKTILDKQSMWAAVQPQPLQLCFTAFKQVLINDRATAEVSVSFKSSPDEKASKQLITGPAEHWFLSGDAIVKGAKELKYDPDKKAIFSRDKPEQLYLGINWMVGDVYSRYDRLSTQRAVLKLMILPSRHPFDSVGVGVAYRFADGVIDFESGLKPTGGFMVFAGHFWTKNDTVDASGNTTQDGRSRSWRIGVSYGLDSLLGWVK